MQRTTLIVAALLVAAPARADDFCHALKQVIADAKDTFPNIRGAHADGMDDYYPSPVVVLPGAAQGASGAPDCTVTVIGGPGAYSCNFPSSDQWRSETGALRDRVTACLGVQPQAGNIGSDHPGYDYAAGGTSVNVGYGDQSLSIVVESPDAP